MTPILLLGAGRMGGALIEGWTRAGAVKAADIMVRDPAAPAIEGVKLNPPDGELSAARTVVLAVKPQVWREAAAVANHLAADAIIVSISAGVAAGDIRQAFGGRRVARVMPTTAVAIGKGTASVYSDDAEARAAAHALLSPVASVVDLAGEELMHAATAVSGSGPAYLYAFVEALEAAGVAAGLNARSAKALARSTITGAAALLADSGVEPSELRAKVTSPGGTTQAALEVLTAELPDLLARAVEAAAKRSRELGE